MPQELLHLDDVSEGILNRTLVVYRKSSGEQVKYKFRTKKTLFTIKIEQESVAELEDKIANSGQNIEIIDV